MKNYIKHAVIVLGTCWVSATIASPIPTWNKNNYSPYVDLTINTHWDSEYQDMEPMDLLAIATGSGVQTFSLAFITDSGNCNAAWGGQASLTTASKWGLHVLDKLRQNHIQYIISFGGQTGTDLSEACTQEQLTAAYENIITTYAPSGIDFDIENNSVNVKKVMQSIQHIQQTHPTLPIIFTLPVLPEGLVADGKNVVQQAQTANLHFTVNIMAMDFGPAYTNAMGEYAIQAAINLNTFLQHLYPEKSAAEIWRMIKVTPMIGVNDVNVERFTLKDADLLRNFAKQNQLAGIAIWSMARDMPCQDQWASPVCSGANLQTQPYEFSTRFLQ